MLIFAGWETLCCGKNQLITIFVVNTLQAAFFVNKQTEQSVKMLIVNFLNLQKKSKTPLQSFWKFVCSFYKPLKFFNQPQKRNPL
jgi:hypothetical protein